MVERLVPPLLPDWLDSQVPFERYLVDVGDGLRIHVMEQGEGRPVLALHGNPTWGYLYRKVAAELAGEPLRLIMPDLIGLGFSDRPAMADFTLANHARWMATLIEKLGLEDVVAVVQDWGGPIGLLALSRFPGLMTGLVVMNTVLGPPKSGFKPTTFHRFFSTKAGELASRWLGLPQDRLGFAQGDRRSISGIVQRAYSYPLKTLGSEAVIAFVRMVPDTLDHPSVPQLGELAAFVDAYDGPAAIVWGDKDPVLGRLRNRISRQLPQATVTATSAGHFLQEEVPSLIAKAIN
ncbi:MAG: alpha/beta fold hydrolase, partial [Acidimicrobiia bacterium]